APLSPGTNYQPSSERGGKPMFRPKFRRPQPFVAVTSLVLLALLLSACAPVAAPGGEGAAEARPQLTIWVATTFTTDADAYQDNLIQQWADENNVDVEVARMSQDERQPRWQTA